MHIINQSNNKSISVKSEEANHQMSLEGKISPTNQSIINQSEINNNNNSNNPASSDLNDKPSDDILIDRKEVSAANDNINLSILSEVKLEHNSSHNVHKIDSGSTHSARDHGSYTSEHASYSSQGVDGYLPSYSPSRAYNEYYHLQPADTQLADYMYAPSMSLTPSAGGAITQHSYDTASFINSASNPVYVPTTRASLSMAHPHSQYLPHSSSPGLQGQQPMQVTSHAAAAVWSPQGDPSSYTGSPMVHPSMSQRFSFPSSPPISTTGGALSARHPGTSSGTPNGLTYASYMNPEFASWSSFDGSMALHPNMAGRGVGLARRPSSGELIKFVSLPTTPPPARPCSSSYSRSSPHPHPCYRGFICNCANRDKQ